MTKLAEVKSKIKDTLETLVRKEILREVQVDDLKTHIWDRNYGAFPVAVLTTPSTENEALTNVQNIRTYTFPIFVIVNAQDVSSSDQVEELIENILNEFDNDPTLKAGGADGEADGGVEPASSTPEAVVSRGKSYIAFVVTLRCKAVRDLTYQ